MAMGSGVTTAGPRIEKAVQIGARIRMEVVIDPTARRTEGSRERGVEQRFIEQLNDSGHGPIVTTQAARQLEFLGE